MDTTVSTSTTHLRCSFKYLKKQILKDKSLYETQFYGGRIFTQFYHQNFFVDDDVSKELLRWEEGEEKLGLSWNIGLGDMINAFSQNKKSISVMEDF